MPVMEIGIVRVPMHKRPMSMRVTMRLARRIVRSVRMPMVFIMRVLVFMLHDLMSVFMLVALGQM
jgi:hypothetical protein